MHTGAGVGRELVGMWLKWRREGSGPRQVRGQGRGMRVGPELRGTERAVCRGERSCDGRAQRDHWFG